MDTIDTTERAATAHDPEIEQLALRIRLVGALALLAVAILLLGR